MKPLGIPSFFLLHKQTTTLSSIKGTKNGDGDKGWWEIWELLLHRLTFKFTNNYNNEYVLYIVNM